MPPEQRIGLHIKRTEQELIATKTAALRPYGLTVPQYSALMFIADQPGISAAALARACLVTPQTMATVLTNLETKKLITRQPHPWHRNATELTLTPDGQQLLEQADAVASAIEQHIADTFTPTEQAQLIEMLSRVSKVLAETHSDTATTPLTDDSPA
ncbi:MULTISPECIES: MarR family winged helix-turn-helix transcriptional regulator [unclassified Frankia]|uniref:MarR family winged helix-turn-helix transcriptional regulator n=1 Tax=unclassified Frankia TaxID=2632575 RepID=UPI002023FABB